jgi:hypothetical protein
MRRLAILGALLLVGSWVVASADSEKKIVAVERFGAAPAWSGPQKIQADRSGHVFLLQADTLEVYPVGKGGRLGEPAKLEAASPINEPAKSLGPPPEIVTQHLRTIAKQRLAPHVEKAVEALGTVSSLHLRARITVTSKDTGNLPVAGDFEYWEQGGKYRIHMGIDVAEAMVSELAYDGRQFQLVLPKGTPLLSVARADERMVPLGIPNPFFLVLQPLSVTTPECPGCVLRLSDLRTLRSLRQAAGATEPGVSRTDDSSFKVTLAASGDPAAIELTQGAGEVVERADLSDYREVEGVGIDMPRAVSFHRTVKTDDSVLHVAITYRIDELQLGSDIDSSVFTLDRSAYKRVWDGDRKVFLKNVESDCRKQQSPQRLPPS